MYIYIYTHIGKLSDQLNAVHQRLRADACRCIADVYVNFEIRSVFIISNRKISN